MNLKRIQISILAVTAQKALGFTPSYVTLSEDESLKSESFIDVSSSQLTILVGDIKAVFYCIV